VLCSLAGSGLLAQGSLCRHDAHGVNDVTCLDLASLHRLLISQVLASEQQACCFSIKAFVALLEHLLDACDCVRALQSVFLFATSQCLDLDLHAAFIWLRSCLLLALSLLRLGAALLSRVVWLRHVLAEGHCAE